MFIVDGIDQLRGDSNAVTGAPDAALDHVAHAELETDVPHGQGFVFECKRGISGDHEKRAEFRQLGNDVLADAVGEEFLLAVVAHVVERQHRDRRFRRQFEFAGRWHIVSGAGGTAGFAPGPDRVSPDRVVESFQLLFPEVFVFERQAFRQGFVSRSLDTDPAWRRQLFQSLGQHDSPARYRTVRDHDLTHGDAYAQLRADFVTQAIDIFAVSGLESHRRRERIRRPRKFGNQRVAANLVGGAAMPGDGLGETAKHVLEPRVR